MNTRAMMYSSTIEIRGTYWDINKEINSSLDKKMPKEMESMKRIAVVIYDYFCMFEYSVALEMFAMSGEVKVDIYGEEVKAYRSEEGVLSVAEYSLDELRAKEYDGLILTGFATEDVKIINNQRFLEIIREFYQQNKVIGAISAAPVFLVKAGVLNGVPFMCGCPKEGLYEGGFTKEELEHMIEWKEAWAQRDTLKFIRQGCIVTAVAFGFREWAMEIGKMLGIKTYPESFGIKEVE